MIIVFCVMIYVNCICLKKRKHKHLNHQDILQKKNEIYHLFGIVQPAEEIEILPYVNGFVENVYVKRGQVVEAGEILLQIGQRPYIVAKETSYANLLRAKQYLKKIQASYQRIKEKNKADNTGFGVDCAYRYNIWIFDCQLYTHCAWRRLFNRHRVSCSSGWAAFGIRGCSSCWRYIGSIRADILCL